MVKEVICCTKLLLHHKTYQNTELQTFLSLGAVKRKMAKNDHVHEAGKVQKNNATFIIFFLVFGKLNISLLFRPFTSEVLVQYYFHYPYIISNYLEGAVWLKPVWPCLWLPPKNGKWELSSLSSIASSMMSLTIGVHLDIWYVWSLIRFLRLICQIFLRLP